MAPPSQSIVDLDWVDILHGSSVDDPIQLVPGSSYGRALKLHSELQRDIRGRLQGSICPYCSETLDVPLERVTRGGSRTAAYFAVCHTCGFWRRLIVDSLRGGLLDFALYSFVSAAFSHAASHNTCRGGAILTR
jgi:hypothetical protein